MDRGRPSKKDDAKTLKRSRSKRSKSAERRAFENLPKGWKTPDAVQMLEQSEIAALKKQASQQAARFEIMRKEDVDILSRVSLYHVHAWSRAIPLTHPQELRNLDERAEYLRRTCHSLRSGRRNLHSRICQHLRSPRVANFDHEPLLKQEEALAELDASIDEWINKLEQAENRRTRIRQKLLEHVAAAMALPASGIVGVSESLQIAMGVTHPSAPTNLSTPPQSPIKITFTPRTRFSSPSPQRVIAQIPSTIIEQPVVGEAVAFGPGSYQPKENQGSTSAKDNEADEPLTAGMRRASVESIRIYAGDEVAALLVDVEQQMIRMSKTANQATALKETDGDISNEERRKPHHANSHEILQCVLQPTSSYSSLNTSVSNAGTTRSLTSSATARIATPTVIEAEEQAPGEFLLTNAVFNPKTALAP